MTVERAARAGVEGKGAVADMEGAGHQGDADNVPGAASDVLGSASAEYDAWMHMMMHQQGQKM